MKTLIWALLAFLPERYRKRITPFEVPPEGALLSAGVETVAALAILIYRYFHFMMMRLNLLPVRGLLMVAERAGETAIMGFGGVLMVEYLLQFWTLTLLLFATEGMVRMFAAVCGECPPSFPLMAVAALQGRGEERWREFRLGKRVPDEVRASEAGLEIASCRAKRWNRLTTISVAGELFELVEMRAGEAPHRFVYVMRKKAESGVIRSLHEYDPEEVLSEQEMKN